MAKFFWDPNGRFIEAWCLDFSKGCKPRQDGEAMGQVLSQIISSKS